MKITSSFIDKNKTKNGGWTKRQLEILGVSWPPQKGWKSKTLGLILTDFEVKEFQNISRKTFEENGNCAINSLIEIPSGR